MPDHSSASAIRQAAMDILALREHSLFELKSKLSKKFIDDQLVSNVLVCLTEQNLQSDERFTQAFINMRQRQGKGPVLIKMELRERGVMAEIIDSLLDEKNHHWAELAQDVRIRRYGNNAKLEYKEKMRQMRFLQTRGFAIEQIQQAFHPGIADFY